MRPLLVGEVNPFGSNPAFALYPLPERSSGGRLMKILGLTYRQYLKRFDRINLCEWEWRMGQARHRAEWLVSTYPDRVIVLLGAKVSRAFGVPYEPFTTHGAYRVLPHPSGLNRAWNDPSAVEKARNLLKEFTE